VTTPMPARAGRREWIGLGVIALPCLLYAMDGTVLDLAVPRLSADLRPTSAQLLWIVDIYGFVLSGFLIPMGTLGDLLGRRRLLLIGAAAFGVASIGAAFATSAAMLIAARAIMGVAGATLAPSTLSLIRNMFADADERRFAIGVWVTSYSAGAVVGPLAGGVLLTHFWWGSVFLIAVPVMILLLVVGPVLLPEYRDPTARHIDVPSVALSLAAVLLVVYGIKRAAEGITDRFAVLAVVGGVLVGAAFIVRQRSLRDPLVDLDLFRVSAFRTAFGSYAIGTFLIFGIYFLIAQYLQSVLGLSPLDAGLVNLPFAASFIVGSLTVPRIAQRVSSVTLMGVGFVIAAIGFCLLTRVGIASGALVVIVASSLFALGLAPVVLLATDVIVGAAPPERAGVASALSETGSELGGAFGIALLGSIGTAVYRGAVTHAIPTAVPPDSTEAARRTVGGAMALAQHLPAPVGAQLSYAAREAFVRALSQASWTSAVIAIATAILIALTLRSSSRESPGAGQ
jgi:DHA2 family multidrug resistance protein-like MFS transporter